MFRINLDLWQLFALTVLVLVQGLWLWTSFGFTSSAHGLVSISC